MTALTISDARKNIFQLVDRASEEHKPVLIKGKRYNAVLVGESDWNAIQETLYLTNIPGMKASLREGIDTPAEQMATKLDW